MLAWLKILSVPPNPRLSLTLWSSHTQLESSAFGKSFVVKIDLAVSSLDLDAVDERSMTPPRFATIRCETIGHLECSVTTDSNQGKDVAQGLGQCMQYNNRKQFHCS